MHFIIEELFFAIFIAAFLCIMSDAFDCKDPRVIFGNMARKTFKWHEYNQYKTSVMTGSIKT